MKIDINYYPGWVRKAVTFSIDDGNLEFDKRFIDIVKPNGIIGTFNFSSLDLKRLSADGYRTMYSGFGVSNHCKCHPFAMVPEKNRELSGEPFDAVKSDKGKCYFSGVEGLYYFYNSDIGDWRRVASDEAYKRLVDEGKAEIEAVFGKGSVTTYVWPYCEQPNEAVKDYVINKCGYKAVRKTGNVGNSTGFAVPEDVMHWSYNANHKTLSECSRQFEEYPDDGELKFFCFGVHSIDYERAMCWNVLEDFAKRFGNRPENYWSASVEDIFSYRDAVRSVIITDEKIENPTDIKLYMKVDGERMLLAPNSSIDLKA